MSLFDSWFGKSNQQTDIYGPPAPTQTNTATTGQDTGFWGKFASQLLDTGGKVFTTKVTAESQGKLTAVQKQQALADAQRTQMLKTWVPIGIGAVILIAVLGFFFQRSRSA